MEADICETTDAKAVPVGELLSRIAAELRGLTEAVDGLQLLVGGLLSKEAAREAGALRRLQDFDRLSQTISGVADFTEALGGAAPERWRLNPHPASRILLLADLAARLVSRERATAPAEPSIAGEFEFF